MICKQDYLTCKHNNPMICKHNYSMICKHDYPMIGAVVAEWLSSWLAEQEDRGSIPGLAT